MILFYAGAAVLASGSLVLLGLHHFRILKLHDEVDGLKCHLKDKIGYKPGLTIQEQITEELHLLTEDKSPSLW